MRCNDKGKDSITHSRVNRILSTHSSAAYGRVPDSLSITFSIAGVAEDQASQRGKELSVTERGEGGAAGRISNTVLCIRVRMGMGVLGYTAGYDTRLVDPVGAHRVACFATGGRSVCTVCRGICTELQ